MMDKQIEEMTKHCPFYYDGNCILCEELWTECDRKCDMCEFAKRLYNADYRKASDVARKIFEEIENAIGYDFYSGEELRIVFALSKLDEVKRKHLNENFFVKMTHTCPHNIPDLVTSISD